jgi:hypothetical protein
VPVGSEPTIAQLMLATSARPERGAMMANAAQGCVRRLIRLVLIAVALTTVTPLTGETAHAQDCMDWSRPMPGYRFGHAMAFDEKRGVLVMFGGNQNYPSNAAFRRAR